MNFKKLEVYGFKSFADKLVVEFAPGITAIVGPNGCGKSNVSDSIRWALGEQSAKSLRGGQMLDVIFSGTETRKSMSYCEVSLYFDNTNRIFNTEYDEIVITRKLYRNLESVYMINKQEARLRDVTALLHDSGLGRDSYSIIGQGRIDEILSAKAEDRRAIFEDAAGIGKYKQVKNENERRLERINEKLMRVIDITTEQEKQLKPLAQQAENARKAFALKDTLRTLEVNTYLYQHDTAESRKDAIRAKINGLNEEMAARQKEYDDANAEYLKSLDDMSGIDDKMRDLNNDRLNITVNLERRVGEIKLMQSKITSMKEQNVLLQEEIDRSAQKLAESQAEIHTLSEDKIAKQSEIAAQKRVIEDLNAKYLSVTELLMKNEGEVEQSHRELVASIDQLSDVKANMSGLKAERAALEDRTADYRKRADAAKAEMAGLKAKVDVAEIEIKDLEAKYAKLDREAAEQSNRYNESTMTVRDLAVKIDKASQLSITLQAKQKVLEDMVNNMQGYAFSVRKLIGDGKSNPRIGQCIEGHVASLIKVPEGMETAIETALGGAIQNIVVRTEEDAKFLIEYLRINKYGRATFLPISAVRGRKLDREYRSYLNYSGCKGIASDIIEFAPKYQDIFDSLLGKTVIVDHLDTAIRMAKDSGFSFKIVTLEGDIINPHGAMTGGSRKSEMSNILASERELAEIRERVVAAQVEADDLTEKRASAVAMQESSMAALSKCTEAKHALELELSEKNKDRSAEESEVEQHRATCFELEQECRKYFARIEEINRQLESVDVLEAEIASNRVNADSSNRQNQKQYDILKQNRDALHGELTEAKVRDAALATELAGIEQDILRLKSDCINFSSVMEANADKISRNNQIVSQSKVENVVIDNSSEEELREKLRVVEGEINHLDAYKKELQDRMLEIDGVRQNTQTQMAAIAEQKTKRESEIEQIDSTLAFYTERITQEYELEYESCLKYKVEDFDFLHANTESNRIKRELLRMGNINMHAVEDYEELSRRYQEEMADKADLEKSVEDVRSVIADMTKEMLTRFTAQFERIRANFIQCFRSLFGGGNADLILEEGDPLEAGIGILAEPPGKKLQSISLLSGGERALTAIAILFAILMLKPMPFCILDEIEAALDDANVERYAKYLHNFSKRTQFIVITHRKPTMELADNLYGVTMEEKGVSKIVSVKLSEAVKVAEPDAS